MKMWALEYLCDKIKYVGDSYSYGLRNVDDFRIQIVTSTLAL